VSREGVFLGGGRKVVTTRKVGKRKRKGNGFVKMRVVGEVGSDRIRVSVDAIGRCRLRNATSSRSWSEITSTGLRAPSDSQVTAREKGPSLTHENARPTQRKMGETGGMESHERDARLEELTPEQ
jgi:hypothetical protein